MIKLSEHKDDKETILDIKVKTDAGEIIDLEMQLVSTEFIKHRMIDYHANLIRDSLKKGERYGNMKKTISIWIIDEKVFSETDDYLNEFYYIEKDKGFILDTITYICCIELPKLNMKNKPIEDASPLEISLEFIRCANEKSGQYVDDLIRAGGEELNMAYEMLKKATADEILREQAIAREKFQRFVYSAIEDAKAVAEEKALEKVEERALELAEEKALEIVEEKALEIVEEKAKEKARAIAKGFKEDGIPVAIIAKNTGLSEEEIEFL